MIKVNDANGLCHYLKADTIIRISKADSHTTMTRGIDCFVYCADGTTINSEDAAAYVAELIEGETK